MLPGLESADQVRVGAIRVLVELCPELSRPDAAALLQRADLSVKTAIVMQRLGVERPVASRLLEGGSSLKEVADVLRHRSLNTTFIYAKLDSRSLASVALPWPGCAT